MTDRERPWWSSGSATDERVEPGPAAEDRERRAEERVRREAAVGTNGDGRDRTGDAHEHSAAHGAAAGEVCAVCPICTALRLVGEVRPDLLVHLTEAARHLTLAAKTIIDAQAGGFGGRGLEHIPLDDDPS